MYRRNQNRRKETEKKSNRQPLFYVVLTEQAYYTNIGLNHRRSYFYLSKNIVCTWIAGHVIDREWRGQQRTITFYVLKIWICGAGHSSCAIATHCHRTKCEHFNVIGEYFKCGDGTVLSPPNMNELLTWLSLVAWRESQAAHTTGVDDIRLAVRTLWWMFQHLLFFHISAHNSFEQPMTTLSLDLVVSRRKNQ